MDLDWYVFVLETNVFASDVMLNFLDVICIVFKCLFVCIRMDVRTYISMST